MASDSSYSRLTDAWNASSTAKVVSLARHGLTALARQAGFATRPDPDGVLWISSPGGMPPPAAVTSLTSLAGTPHNFHIEHLQPMADVALERLLGDRHPRLLVADVDWCASIGIAAVRHLHRQRPDIDWLLCWDAPSPRWLETLVQSGARGAVLRSADQTTLARAFDAVTQGELWLPRQVMQWLYATLVNGPASNEHVSTAPPSGWSADSELTPRESQVSALMRQGLTNRDIALRLGVSINTVKKHLGSAYEKQGLRSRRQALR